MSRSALATFVGVYLDEDLVDAYDDEFDAADHFVATNPELAATLPGEIATVLAQRSEPEIEALLSDLGMGIDTRELTCREWLTQIAERVSASTR